MTRTDKSKDTPSILIIAASLVCAASFPAALRAQETVLELDSARTKVEFTLGDILHTVHGSFQLKRGIIHFDPAGGKAGGELVVDARSGASGSGARDRRMHKNILESERYPEIIFTPDHVQGALSPHGASAVQVHGMFRIHGAEHELTLNVEAAMEHDQLTATTQFTVPYVQWGMKNPSTFLLRVSDKVQIEIHAVGHIVPAVTR